MEISQKYHSKHSLNAPAHITLLSPFDLKGTTEKLDLFLEEFCNQHAIFEVNIKGFSNFGKRVFYMDIIPSKDLLYLQEALENKVRELPEIFSYKYHARPYRPHLTLAFKDLTEENFLRIQEDFKDQHFEASFICNQLVLLKHENKKWKEVGAFRLKE